MRILVFDNNPINRAAAQAQLTGHDLTVVGTYDEAHEMLIPRVDYAKASATLRSQFGDFNPHLSKDEKKRGAYFAAETAAYKKAITHPNFDVVLCDLLVPASRQSQGPQGLTLVGKEMPVGIFIGLLAAVRARAKYVAVFTDSDHHSHPASACFDAFNSTGESLPTPFMVEGSKIILSNNRNWIGQFDPGVLSKPLGYNDYVQRPNTIRAKNWAALLAYLIAD